MMPIPVASLGHTKDKTKFSGRLHKKIGNYNLFGGSYGSEWEIPVTEGARTLRTSLKGLLSGASALRT